MLRRITWKILSTLLLWTSVIQPVNAQNSTPLFPVSGADGTFTIETVEGVNVYRNEWPQSLYIYFPTDVPVQSTTVWVKVTYFDIGNSNFLLQYNSTSNDYELAPVTIAADMQNTHGIRSAIFELPNADFRNAQNLGADLRITVQPFDAMNIVSAELYLERPSMLSTPAPSFTMNSKYVSATVFHWYATNGGQLTGPWRPIEGRPNWTGQTDWWKSQVKQIMAANIDAIWVHLIPQTENIRVNLFRALYEMRAEGYDVPKVAPFLDPLITWHNQPNIDLNTTAGKDSLAAQYIRFFNQYFGANPDELAEDYLAKIDGRVNLDTWHVHLNMDNVASMTRADLESRLQNALASTYPVFNNGIYMITTAYSPQVFSFADQRTPQFEINEYFVTNDFMGIKSLQIKGGYWDQNVRTPGDFLPRDGGVHFDSAWAQVDNSIDRIYLESWNEYDEGTGHYAADTSAPYIHPGSNNTNDDFWSITNDPYEYINTNAHGAALWNDIPENDAVMLSHTFPDTLEAGGVDTVFVTVRNTGDARWNGADGYYFGQVDTGVPIFSAPMPINDLQDDIPTFGGIFRGRPKTFILKPTAPGAPGVYNTKWRMGKTGMGWFGEELDVVIVVDGSTGISDNEETETTPKDFSLSQNYPNPFNPSTTIRFYLPENRGTALRLEIYNTLGQLIKSYNNLSIHSRPAGWQEIKWSSRDSQGQLVPSGLYFYRLIAGNQFIQTKKMLLVR